MLSPLDQFSFDERLLFRLFIKLISIKRKSRMDKLLSYMDIDTPVDLNNILFLLHNFSYINSELIVNINEKEKPERFYLNNIQNKSNLIIDTLKDIINIKNINQLKEYYSNLDIYLKSKNIIYDEIKYERWIGHFNFYSKMYILILIDILFQNNIINSNNILPRISIYVNGKLSEETDNPVTSTDLLNKYTYEFEKLINYVYIERPLTIMSPMVADMYRGGYYNKYIKYQQKLLN
jgi:hypothetical protein